MNQCTFMGNLTRDPKLTPTKNGNQVVTFGMATNRWYKRADGENANEATFLEMEAWDSGAQRIFETFQKGDRILVECSAKNSAWTDPNGVEQKRMVFRVSRFYDISRRSLKDDENNE
jgi:single-strand DNA-binding protein